MLSNNNHINNIIVTRSNYEEYFLLYVDNELTAEEKLAVETFVAIHPDLKEELDILLSTKLPIVSVTLESKEPFFAKAMKENVEDESLLLYVDDELSLEKKKSVEEKIKADSDYQYQYQLLLKTKLNSNEKIVYPYKKDLYQYTEKRILPYWLRIAAAIIIILGAGTFGWLSRSNNNDSGNVAIHIKPSIQPSDTPDTAVVTSQSLTKDIVVQETTKQASHTTSTVNSSKATIVKQKSINNNIAADKVAIINDALLENPITVVDLKQNSIEKTSQQIINNDAVTLQITPTYINTEAAQTTKVPVDALAITNNEKRGGSIKGFFRKATRFIERTTNINTTNEDDELLLGAVAIKLK